MKSKSSQRKRHIRKLLLIPALIGLLSGNILVFSNTTIIPCSTAASSIVQWNITLTINGSERTSSTVVFGQHINTSEGQDTLDIPAPPISPQLPSIAAWFDTSLLSPYDKLLYEFKQYPSVNASWNLSILWSPTPGNTTPTEITLYWDSSQLSKDTIDSLFLYENNTILTNMLTTSSYSFVTNGTIHRFQIISQDQPSDYNSEQITKLILPIFISILIIFTVIIIVFFFHNKKRKKSYEKWKEEKTSFQIKEKPKTNIKQKTNEKPTTKKKPQTKRKPTKKQKR